MQIHIIYIVRLLYMYSNYDEKTCITFISYMYERKTREPYFEIVVHVARTLFNFFFHVSCSFCLMISINVKHIKQSCHLILFKKK